MVVSDRGHQSERFVSSLARGSSEDRSECTGRTSSVSSTGRRVMFHNQLFSQSHCPVAYLRRVQGESLRFGYRHGTYRAMQYHVSSAKTDSVQQPAQLFSPTRKTILARIVTVDGSSR